MKISFLRLGPLKIGTCRLNGFEIFHTSALRTMSSIGEITIEADKK